MKKLNVVITADDKHAVSDWNAKGWCESLKDGDTAYVASTTMFGELRVGVRLGHIAPFSFEFDGKTIEVGTKGELNSTGSEQYDPWLDGLFDHQTIQVKMLMSGKSREEVEKSHRDLKKRALERRKRAK